jgi:hypothetical protein
MSRIFALASTLLLLTAGSGHGQEVNETLFKSRELEVRKQTDRLPKVREAVYYNMLLEYRVHFGLSYLKPKEKEWQNNPERDLSRLATTYWHERGPLGVVMQKFNWFPGPVNTYQADARLPASLVGLEMAGLAHGILPAEALVGAWSEPAIGRVGMEVGTVASYARPFQYVDIFDPNAKLISFSFGQGPDKKRFFHFVEGAQERGAMVRPFEGDPRPTLAKQAPRGFYHVLVVEPYKRGVEVMFEDLMTKEGVAQLMELLAEDGILCIHISSRHYELAPLYADIAATLKLACVRGHGSAPVSVRFGPEKLDEMGHFTSEWVMLARDPRLLKALAPPPGYEKALEKAVDDILRGREAPAFRERYLKDNRFWTHPRATGKYVWTDEGPHSFMGLYRNDPIIYRYRQLLWDTERVLRDRVGLSYKTVDTLARPVGSLLDNIDRVSTRNKNGGVEPMFDYD